MCVSLGGSLLVGQMQTLIDEWTVEEMIVCQQHLRGCSAEELRYLISDAVSHYIREFGGKDSEVGSSVVGHSEPSGSSEQTGERKRPRSNTE